MSRRTAHKQRHQALNYLADAMQLVPIPRVLSGCLVDLAAVCCGEGARTFCIPSRLPNGDLAPYSGLDIQRMLRAKGVRMWANWIMIDCDRTIMFTVRGDMAKWTDHLLTEARIEHT